MKWYHGAMSVEDIIESFLAQLGLDGEARQAFVSPDYEVHTHNPFLMRDMEKAANRVVRAIKEKEKMVIYADFDADGIPASVILSDLLAKCGVNARVYIPHRHNEGYGFHSAAVNEFAEEGVSLVVTVDVGISGNEAVEAANKLGIDVIITDHHELPNELPRAYALVHPRIGEYPFEHLCGAAVAFKLAQAILTQLRTEELTDIPEGWEKWLLDMVGIATIADMVPLIGENRVLATYGLTVLRKTPRKGIRELCRKHRIRQHELTEDDIGFVIAPRINAASRMDEPEVALGLLMATSEEDAQQYAAQLEKLNNKRKGAVAALVKAARAKVPPADGLVTVAGDPDWKPSLLGLAANSVLEGRKGVVCLWGRDGKGVLKGSCRSDGSVHVVEMFGAAHIALDESGGHAYAGGFSVSHQEVHTLAEHFAAAAQTAATPSVVQENRAMPLPLSECTFTLFQKLRALAPFGVGNEKPLFMIEGVQVEDVRIFGKEGNHTELYVSANGRKLRAYQFFKTPDDFTHVPATGEMVTLYGTLERDQFKGARAVALRTVDICAVPKGVTMSA